MKLLQILSAAVLILILSSPGFAMRCGSYLVDEGDSRAEVLLKCGEPLFRGVVGERTEYDRYGWRGYRKEIATTEVIEEWIYDLGRGTFLKILTFHGSELVDIEDGDRIR